MSFISRIMAAEQQEWRRQLETDKGRVPATIHISKAPQQKARWV